MDYSIYFIYLFYSLILLKYKTETWFLAWGYVLVDVIAVAVFYAALLLVVPTLASNKKIRKIILNKEIEHEK